MTDPVSRRVFIHPLVEREVELLREEVELLRESGWKYHRAHPCGYCGDNMDGSVVRCAFAEALANLSTPAPDEPVKPEYGGALYNQRFAAPDERDATIAMLRETASELADAYAQNQYARGERAYVALRTALTNTESAARAYRERERADERAKVEREAVTTLALVVAAAGGEVRVPYSLAVGSDLEVQLATDPADAGAWRIYRTRSLNTPANSERNDGRTG